MEKGFLGVTTFAAGRILPISGANVYVSQIQEGKEVLLYSLITDENGNTPIVSVDAPDIELSEKPGSIQPFSLCNIRVIKAGFYRTIIKDVQVFAKRITIQNVDMTPLPENTEGINTTNTFVVLPQNL